MRYPKTTMAEIATRAALDKGTLYLYFAGKVAMILALQEQTTAPLIRQ